MASNNFKIGDKLVFTGDSDIFVLNKIYTISKIYTIDYFIDEVDPNFGKECVNFEDSQYGCFIADVVKQFTKLEDIRNYKLNDLV